MIAAALLVDAAVRGGIGQALLLAPWILLLVWLCYLAVYASHIAVTSSGIRVQNLLRRTFAPWERIVDVELQRQVEIRLDDGSTLAAVGGPSGVMRRRPGLSRPRDADAVPAGIRDFGEISDAWADAKASGHDRPVRRSWDIVGISTFVALGAWAAIAVIITGGPA